MSKIKIEMCISVTGPEGTFSVMRAGGLPSKLGPNEKAQNVIIEATDVREAVLKCYIQTVSCIIASNTKTSMEFVNELGNYNRKLDLYPDDR